MHILVLGGYGLIGLPAVRRLGEAGHQVTGLGRSVRSARISHPDVTWIERDIARLTDPAAWLPLLTGIDAVVNCSGSESDYRKLESRLINDLLDRGLVHPDPLGLGLATG